MCVLARVYYMLCVVVWVCLRDRGLYRLLGVTSFSVEDIVTYLHFF